MTASAVTIVEDSYTIEITEQSAGTVEVTASEAPVIEVSNEDTTIELTASAETVVITERETHTVEVNEPSHVVVHTAGIGSGIGGFYNQSEILLLLNNALSIDQFIPGLSDDLTELAAFWQRIGSQLNAYTTGEATTLQATMETYTDDLIATTMVAVNANSDSIDYNATTVSQTNARIDLNAIDITQNGDDITIHSATLTVQAGQISTNVTDISILDGRMSAAETNITQTANDLLFEALRIDDTELGIIDNAAAILVNADSITSYVTQLNENTGNINSLEVELTATSATTTITQTSLAGTQADLESVELQLADYWGVKITEVNGVPYITSMGLTLHADWITSTVYVVDDYIFWWDAGVGKIYRCILGHTADATNAPGVVPENYWVEDLTGKKSTFRVDAELFEVYNADATPGQEQSLLFQVDGDALTLGYGVALQSEGWGVGDPGYSLDAAAKTAEFRDITMVFSTSDDKLDTRTDLGVGQKLFTATPTVPYAIGDLWDRGSTLGIYRCDTAKTSTQSYSISDWRLMADGTYYNTAADIINQGALATKDTVDWDGSDIANQPPDADILNAQQAWADLNDNDYFAITESGLVLKDAAAHIVLGYASGDGGSLTTYGKTQHFSSTAGIFLGWDVTATPDAYCFGIGDATNYMYWNGVNLVLSNDLIISGHIAANEVVQVNGMFWESGYVTVNSTSYVGFTLGYVSVYRDDSQFAHIYYTIHGQTVSGNSNEWFGIFDIRRGASWATGTSIMENEVNLTFPKVTSGALSPTEQTMSRQQTIHIVDPAPAAGWNHYWIGFKCAGSGTSGEIHGVYGTGLMRPGA